MSNKIACRWGILSAAAIAKKNWRAIAQTTGSTVVAVASRRKEAAEKFVEECTAHTPQRTPVDALGSYDELLKRSDIDAVYIPLPTGLRKEWIIKAAEHGKHVLAEKPAALTAKDLEEVLAVCKMNNVQFMDGVMFMHSARMERLKAALQDKNNVGDIRRIASQFSFNGGDEFDKSNIRTDSVLEPFGCLGDLGWYCIRFILWVNDYKMPSRVSARTITGRKGDASSSPVPAEFSAELDFDGGVSASFYCSFLTEHQQWVHISGTKGSICVEDFVLPYYGNESSFEIRKPVFDTHVCSFHMKKFTERVAVAEYDSSFAPAQEINMFETFQSIVESKNLDPSWGEICLKTQQVMDMLWESSKE